MPAERLRRFDERIRHHHASGDSEVVVILVSTFLETVLEDLLARMMQAQGAGSKVIALVLDTERSVGQRIGKLFPTLAGESFEDVAAHLGYRDYPHRWRQLRAARNAFIHGESFDDPRETLDHGHGKRGDGPARPGVRAVHPGEQPLRRQRGHAAPGRSMRALQLHVTGIVQGVGFRPFVYNLAVSEGLTGWVLNASDGVHCVVEGPAAAVDAFPALLRERAPAMSVIEHVFAEEVEPQGFSAFEIRESKAEAGAMTLVSPDIATCPDCTAELFDAADRRYRYPVHQLHELRPALHDHR